MEDRPEHGSRPERRTDPALRQRLVKRIGLAGLAIAALLGGLVVIDRYYVPPPSSLPHAVEVALTPLSLKPPETPLAAAPIVAAPLPIVPAEPEQPSAPGITRPAGLRPTEAAKPTEMTKTAKPSKSVTAGVVALASQAKPAASKAPIAENDRPLPRSTARPATPSKPLGRDKGAQKQYVFQMGIFNDVAKAQHLSEKLKESGVSSRIEVRVQVGPFKTRKEAETARKKLLALGIKPGTLMLVRK